MRLPNPVRSTAPARTNAAITSHTVSSPNPSSSRLSSSVWVTPTMTRLMSTIGPIASGRRMKATMVATKTKRTRQPAALTPSGASSTKPSAATTR